MRKTNQNAELVRMVNRAVQTLGVDGTQPFINMIEADKTPEEILAAMMPFIQRTAGRQREVKANG